MNACRLRGHGALRFLLPVLTVAAVLSAPSSAGAVGLDGPADAERRLKVGLGAGADRVSGYGQDTYPFAELSAAGEALVWKRLSVGLAVSARWDLADYNDPLGRWRGNNGAAMAAQLFVGYDGPRFHISVGPWFYAARRQRPELRASVMPYGVLRMRIGHLDRWHFNLHILDGAPFTAEGGALGVRLLLGTPVWGRHRPTAGVYTTIGEKVAGVAVADEIAGVGLGGSALRLGVLLGTDLERPTTRPEATAFAGLAW
jgi:hypothetical protein